LAAWACGFVLPAGRAGDPGRKVPAMPVRSDAATATSRWVNGMSNSSDAAKRGVAAVNVSPGLSASQAADKWLAKVTQSKDKFARRTAAVTLQQWQASMNNYGIQRMASGAQQKQQKFTSFMQEYLPYLKSGVEQIQQMPKNTLDDSINRMVAMVRHNAQFQRGTGAMG
jgi:hypothetical protein